MNIQDQAPGFISKMPVSEFTGEVQENIVKGYFGIDTPKPAPALRPGEIAVSAAEYEKMKADLGNYNTVFSDPRVSGRIGEILGVVAPVTHTAPPASGMNQQAVVTPNPAPPVAQQAQTPVDNGKDWWNTYIDPAGQQPAAASTTVDNNGQTVDNRQVGDTGHGATPPLNNPIDGRLNQYINAVGQASIANGVDPREVLDFLNQMTPEQGVKLFIESRKQPAQSSPINLAEERGATGPINVRVGITDPFAAQKRFRV